MIELELEGLRQGGVGFVVLRRGPRGHKVLRDLLATAPEERVEEVATRLGHLMAFGVGFTPAQAAHLQAISEELLDTGQHSCEWSAIVETVTAMITYQCSCPKHMN